jgi:glucokinase
MFVSILAAKAGNLALTVLATGGVYLAGGMPLHLLPALRGEGFMQAFTRKGRLSDLMQRMPVHVVVRKAALYGAAIRGLELGMDPVRSSSDVPLPGPGAMRQGGD